MQRETHHNWAIAMIGAAYAAFLASLLASQWRAWLAFSLGLLALAFFARFRREIWLERPRVEIEYARTGTTHIPNEDSARKDAIGDNAHLAYLCVRNSPLKGDAPIYGAHVELSFTDEKSGQVLHEKVRARWSFIFPVLSEVEATIPRLADILGSSSKYEIDLAFKMYDETEMYVINDESGFLKPQRFRARPLGDGPALVDVHFHGTTSGPPIDERARFRLVNEPEQGVILERLSPTSDLEQLRTRATRFHAPVSRLLMRFLGLDPEGKSNA